MTKPILALALATLAASNAIPSPRVQPRQDEDWNPDDADMVCLQPFGNDEQRAALWERSGSGRILDEWVQENSRMPWGMEWFSSLTEHVYGQTGALDCNIISSGNCNIGEDSCREMVASGMGQYYWILKSVSTLQNAYAHMHEELQNTAIINTLTMDQVEEDFGPEPIESDEIWALSSVFGLVSTFDSPGEAGEIDLNEVIRLYFVASDDALQLTIDRALGWADMTRLPESSLTGDYTTGVARFFADGKYLIDNISGHFANIFEEARVRSLQRVAFEALLQQNHAMVVGGPGLTEEVCAERATGYWDSLQCLQFLEIDGEFAMDMDEDTVSKLVDDYGVDWEEVLSNASSCAVWHGGESDPTVFPLDGSILACFYNMPVYRYEWNSDDSTFDLVLLT